MLTPPKKPWYRRKRLWLGVILLAPVLALLIYLVADPLPHFRKTVHFLLARYGVTQKNIRVGRRPIHIYEAGKGKPHTVILLHGFGGNAMFTWMRLLPALGEDFHVIAPDLLASNFFQLNPKTYSVLEEKKLVLDLIDHLGIKRADFVGLSLGGWVSLMIALERPELVDRMVLVESAGLWMEIPELTRLTLTDRETARKFMGLLFFNPPPLPGFVLDELVKSSTKVKKKYEVVFQGFLENSQNHLLDGRLGEIRQPTLIIHGREDQVIPLEAGLRIHQAIPGSEMIILEESGHAPVWDQPGKLKKAILEFLLRGRN